MREMIPKLMLTPFFITFISQTSRELKRAEPGHIQYNLAGSIESKNRIIQEKLRVRDMTLGKIFTVVSNYATYY